MILQMVFVETLHMILGGWRPSYGFTVTHEQNAEKRGSLKWSQYGVTANTRSPSLHFLSTDNRSVFPPLLKGCQTIQQEMHHQSQLQTPL